MKLTLLILLFSFNLSAKEPILISADGNRPGVGFVDSSFSHNPDKSFCYLGFVTKVCPHIYQAAANMQMQYSSGNHDTIEILNCAVKNDNDPYEVRYGDEYVVVEYKLTDDYGGDISVKKTINICPK